MLRTTGYRRGGVLQTGCSLSWTSACDPRDTEPHSTWTLHAHIFLPHVNPRLLSSQKWEPLPSASQPWCVAYRTTQARSHGFRLHPTMATEAKTNSVLAEGQGNSETQKDLWQTVTQAVQEVLGDVFDSRRVCRVEDRWLREQISVQLV